MKTQEQLAEVIEWASSTETGVFTPDGHRVIWSESILARLEELQRTMVAMAVLGAALAFGLFTIGRLIAQAAL